MVTQNAWAVNFPPARVVLLNYIANENVGIDVGFWFMEDARYTAALKARRDAGVPIRVIMDQCANASTPLNVDRLTELQSAGIPMRQKNTGGIMRCERRMRRVRLGLAG